MNTVYLGRAPQTFPSFLRISFLETSQDAWIESFLQIVRSSERKSFVLPRFVVEHDHGDMPKGPGTFQEETNTLYYPGYHGDTTDSYAEFLVYWGAVMALPGYDSATLAVNQILDYPGGIQSPQWAAFLVLHRDLENRGRL